MKPRKQYTQESNDQALELINSSKSAVELAGELGVGSVRIDAWKRNALKLGKIGSRGFKALDVESEINRVK